LPINHRKPIVIDFTFLASLNRDGKRYCGEFRAPVASAAAARRQKSNQLAHGPCTISAEARIAIPLKHCAGGGD
jgi:hypothetical protein